MSADSSAARRFAASVNAAERADPPPESDEPPRLTLTSATQVESLRDAARHVQFRDEGVEGRLAWQLARDAGHAPLLLCEYAERDAAFWRRAERRLEVLGEGACASPAGPLRRALYRARDARCFDAVLFRAAHEGVMPEALLPGDADPQRVLAAAAAFPSPAERGFVPIGFQEGLRHLAAEVGWACGHTYGGDALEYLGLFCANEASVAARFWDLAAAVGAEREDRRIARW